MTARSPQLPEREPEAFFEDLLGRAAEVAARILAPRAGATDQAERVPEENIRCMAELGLLGLATPTRYGGLGVLPQDMDLRTVERIVRAIKSADPRYDTALAVSPDATLRDVVGIIRKRAHKPASVE